MRPLAALRLRHPAQFVVLAFAAAILVGTVVLMVPTASEAPGSPPFLVALFTATSAVCVTGLVVVDTVSWSGFGEVAIMAMMQIGGFGIMTLASLLALLVSRRLGLRGRMLLQSESGDVGVTDIRAVVFGVAAVMIVVEVTATVVMGAWLWLRYDHPLGEAAYLGLFHAISALNNAGFSLFEGSIAPFESDIVMNLAIMVPVLIGALGFPVLRELQRAPRNRRGWSLHTKMTLLATAGAVVVGTGLFLVFEWSNPGTVGDVGAGQKLIPALFHGIAARTSGFHSMDVGAMQQPTLVITMVLMFIGGGAAGTAGGIKVTTIAVLLYVVLTEARGEPEVNALGRRIPIGAQRQALSIALVGMVAVVAGTLVLTATDDHGLSSSLFEVVSAFGITGLSTGITPELTDPARIVLMVLMFLGRVGPITLAAALALREKERRFRVPEERPIIG
jgi:trk system potassium uptake protein